MGLIDILPVSMRAALLFAKSAKIAKTDITNKEKLEMIRKKENFWKGKYGFNPEKTGKEQAIAVSIGLTDLAKIYNSIDSPDDALRCLDTIGNTLTDSLNSLPNTEQTAHKRQSIYENQIWAWLYEAMAYAKKNNTEKCRELLDRINVSINKKIESEPANKRLVDFCAYTVSQTFDIFINLAKDFPESQQKAYHTCLSLLKAFKERDPGNETVQEYIERFH
jgi:hypothetical protein